MKKINLKITKSKKIPSKLAREAVQIFAHELGVDEPQAWDQARPGDAHDQPAVARCEKLFYELVAFPRFCDRLIAFLGLNNSLKKTVDISVGSFKYQPNGIPPTPDQLEIINEFIQKYLKVSPESVEAIAVRTFVLGKIIATAEKELKSRKIILDTLPKNLKLAAKQYSLNLKEVNAIRFAQTSAAEHITKITETTRRTVVDSIVQAAKNRKHPRKLAQELRSKITDSGSNLNRDWERVAVTEAGETSNNGFIATQPVGSYVVGVSFPDACDWCKANINGKVFRVADGSPGDYSDLAPSSSQYKELAQRWETEIWVGKSNVGRSRYGRKYVSGSLVHREHHEIAQGAPIGHPNCRCRWFAFDPKRQFVDSKGEWQWRTDDREKEYQKWLARNPHTKEPESV